MGQILLQELSRRMIWILTLCEEVNASMPNQNALTDIRTKLPFPFAVYSFGVINPAKQPSFAPCVSFDSETHAPQNVNDKK